MKAPTNRPRPPEGRTSKMKVLLVNPDYEIERYMGRHFGRMGWVMPPMGLLYLAAELEAQGHRGRGL